MPKKNTLAAVALAFLLAAGMAHEAWAQSGPPLAGAFADNFNLMKEPTPAPQDTVEGPDGSQVGIADFEGQVVLLNFWATWCAPCVTEMPSLDRVQAALGPEGLVVMAVSEDRDRDAALAFLEEHELDRLDLYSDPKGGFARAFSVSGLPTTIIIDRQGRAVGGLLGPAEWDGPEAEALLRYYLEQPAGEEMIKTGG